MVRVCFSQNFAPFLEKMTKSVLVLFAEGAEEIELVVSTSIFKRSGMNVTIAGVDSIGCIRGSRGIQICTTSAIEAVLADKNDAHDAVVLPGGLGGAKNLSESAEVKELLLKYEKDGKIIAAICAAPIVLKKHGIALGKSLTSYPSVKDQVMADNEYEYKEEKVVKDGNLITSRGPGTAFDFALTIVEALLGPDVRNKTAAGLLL